MVDTVAPRVGIIMGSDSDLPVMKDAAKILNDFDVPIEVSSVIIFNHNGSALISYLYQFLFKLLTNQTLQVRIVSAHRTPELMFSYARSAHERGVQIIIAGAGGAAHLPGYYL